MSQLAIPRLFRVDHCSRMDREIKAQVTNMPNQHTLIHFTVTNICLTWLRVFVGRKYLHVIRVNWCDSWANLEYVFFVIESLALVSHRSF